LTVEVIAMTEWNAPEYARVSGLQEAMAAEVLSLLELKGTERVLDLGCGNGKVTARIAARVPRGSVLGVDSSSEMIAFALQNFSGAEYPNLRFEVMDICALPFRQEFDLIVSFNALHWIPEQAKALGRVREAIKPDGQAQLRLVPKGERKSLEDVLEETRKSLRWERYFVGFRDPYLHLTPEEYRALAEQVGFKVERLHVADKAWDFGSAASFAAFGDVTFIAWTQVLPKAERPVFVRDVLERYSAVAGDDKTFRFYQMDVTLLWG
jgi:trans-aconitate 2-methyltransferase